MANASRSLPTLVRSKFKSAQESGELTFFPTQVSVLQDPGFVFQLRYSPALASKPKAPKPADSKPIDVFHNPEKLLITEWPPSHNLVLNKFAINANHFILATKEWKEQTHLLEPDDLGATYDCIKAYQEDGEDLFAFFNSGEHSGASQPHRHIQFLPVSSMLNGIGEGKKWELLADRLLKEPKLDLPFTYFSSPLPPSPSPTQLHYLYLSLYQQAVAANRRFFNDSKSSIAFSGPAFISYNLAMTKNVMVLCPRRAEGIKVKGNDGHEIGPIALNGTLLGGTLLVKSEEEWLALRDDSSRLGVILAAIGIPSKL